MRVNDKDIFWNHADPAEREKLARYVLENRADITRIFHEAKADVKELTGDPSFYAYVSGDRQRVCQEVQALYRRLQKEKPRAGGDYQVYVLEPPESVGGRQHVRLAPEVLFWGHGTCLDWVLLYAACVRCAHIHPLILITPAHALLGYWVNESDAQGNRKVVLDREEVIPYLPLDEKGNLITAFDNAEYEAEKHRIRVINATRIPQDEKGNLMPFEYAEQEAETHLPQVCFAVDIRAAREMGITPLPPPDHRQYLRRLRRYCQVLPLAALGGQVGAYEDLSEAAERPHRDTLPEWTRGDRDSRPLTALEAALQAPRLVLLGDPGAGKSAFVRMLLARLAAADLGEAKPLPTLSSELLPILITLRDLIPRLSALPLAALSGEKRRQTLAAAVCEQAIADLQRWDAIDFTEGLRAALTTGRCLLVLDGLDEVPPDLRTHIREAAAAVIEEYGVQRVIVTCRVRSYVGETVLPGFQAHTLAPFDEKKIRDFAHAWYNAQKDLGRVDARQAEDKAANLAQAALTEDLRELAENPLLLTTMAIIHQKEIGLPKERVCLYDLAVDILLRRWQQYKAGETAGVANQALVAFLSEDQRLRPAMERLAYEAHRSGQVGEGATDLPRFKELEVLEQRQYLGDIGLANQFLDYVDQQAGLLMGRGGDVGQPAAYSFLHRTFQEYLAGCYMVGGRHRAREFFARAGDGDYWALAVQLGAEELLYNRRSPYELLDLAYHLCPATEATSVQAQRTVLWAGNMAVLAGQEVIERDTDSPDGGPAYLDRLLPRLVTLLQSDLTVPERIEAGITLARLGDPRFHADAWFLPHEPLLGFVKIPAGPFWMGSDAKRDPLAVDNEFPLHEVRLPTYYIARYPLTVAQFRAFVEYSGYEPDQRSLHGLPNHPVVWVSWYHAQAYCAWLTARLREWEGTPEPLATLLREQGWCVTLPSEAEWEKAARGTDERIYPWGNQWDDDTCNIFGRSTTSVGVYPAGVSPYGCHDMAGNVWEWIADWYDADYYQWSPRDHPQGPESGQYRVVRGGAWLGVRSYARASNRYHYTPLSPGNRNYHLGLRCAISLRTP